MSESNPHISDANYDNVVHLGTPLSQYWEAGQNADHHLNDGLSPALSDLDTQSLVAAALDQEVQEAQGDMQVSHSAGDLAGFFDARYRLGQAVLARRAWDAPDAEDPYPPPPASA